MNVATEKHTSALWLKTSTFMHRFKKNMKSFWPQNEASCMKKLWIRVIALGGALSCLLGLGLSASAAITTQTSIEPQTIWRVPLLPDTKGHVHLLNPYRQPNSDYSAGHRGVDYRAPVGTMVYAASTGVVAFSGLVVSRRLITIRHDANLVTEYEPVCSVLSVGEPVKAEQLLGEVCSESPNYSWHCVEPCLHFSLRSAGAYLSPLALIGGLAPSRLLPMGHP
jgi:murein DD-endopeptidase MepM/ murein hydrolase activator NlpD